MNYDKKCKVVRIATTDKMGCIHFANNKWYGTNYAISNRGVEHYHLYVLSDDNIKEGDWAYNQHENMLQNATDKDLLRFCITFKLKKIIGSTDSSLNLLSLPDYFIKQYCVEGGIDEVIVEYEVDWDTNTCQIEKQCKHFSIADQYILCSKHMTNTENCRGCDCARGNLIPKVNPDNTINIHRVKDTWTRDEVVQAILGYWKDLASNGDGNKQDCLNWIEKNV